MIEVDYQRKTSSKFQHINNELRIDLMEIFLYFPQKCMNK